MAGLSSILRVLRARDVSADDIADGETLVWDAGDGRFEPGAGGGGGGPTIAQIARIRYPITFTQVDGAFTELFPHTSFVFNTDTDVFSREDTAGVTVSAAGIYRLDGFYKFEGGSGVTYTGSLKINGADVSAVPSDLEGYVISNQNGVNPLEASHYAELDVDDVVTLGAEQTGGPSDGVRGFLTLTKLT